jgi:hypothetical protein
MDSIVRTIILLLISVSSFGQYAVRDVVTTFTFGGRSWAYMIPTGWDGSRPNCKLFVNMYGNGETSIGLINNVPIGNMIADAGTNWNGIVNKNDGTKDTLAFLLLPNYWDVPAEYAAVIADFIINTSMDTSDHRKYLLGMTSGGVGRGEDYFTMTGHTSPYANLFERYIMASGVATRNFSTFKPYRCHVWIASSEHDNVTAFRHNITTYNSFKANKRLIQYSVRASQTPHSNNVWNTIFNISTLATNTGSTAATNAIRFLCSDGTDGVTVNTIEGIRKINQ